MSYRTFIALWLFRAIAPRQDWIGLKRAISEAKEARQQRGQWYTDIDDDFAGPDNPFNAAPWEEDQAR